MSVKPTAQRDAFLRGIHESFASDPNLFFLSADFGSPILDQIRADYPDRFINVGIAEQNLINVATGLALEGFTVFAYAIAPFITMRCFEQIRVNLAILSQLRDLNVNLVGVGAGISYVVSGPTHHCLEDISVMSTLPNIEVFSPADATTAAAFVPHSLNNRGVRYFRFDARPQPQIHETVARADIERGFIELSHGDQLAIVSTGVMTHTARELINEYEARGIQLGLIDLFRIRGYDRERLLATLQNYRAVVTLEEAFAGKGGLDSAISNLLRKGGLATILEGIGLPDHYLFDIGPREFLHGKSGLDRQSISEKIDKLLQEQ